MEFKKRGPSKSKAASKGAKAVRQGVDKPVSPRSARPAKPRPEGAAIPPKAARPPKFGRTARPPKFERTETPGKLERPSRRRVEEKQFNPSNDIHNSVLDDTKEAFDFEDAPAKEGLIAGRRAVLEVLKNGMQINKIFVLSGEREGSINEIMGIAKERRIQVVFVDKNKIQDLVPGEKHQGVVASIPPVNYVEIEDILTRQTATDVIIVLDGIEDPHNLGAIIRTAEVVGAKGVVIPKRRSVLLTDTVAKASAGAVLHMPVARVSNLVQTIEKLKEKGYWVVGADMAGKGIWQSDLKRPLVVVVGAEGKGISRLLKERCDFLVGIPVNGKISSLNASVATGVILYEISRQNQGK